MRSRKQLQKNSYTSWLSLSLNFLVKDIIDVSVLSKGPLNINFNMEQLYDIVNEVCEKISHRIGPKALMFDLTFNLPWSTRIFTDKHRLQQILNNLLKNAIKYTDKGFIEIAITPKSDLFNDLTITSRSLYDSKSELPSFKQLVSNQQLKPFPFHSQYSAALEIISKTDSGKGIKKEHFGEILKLFGNHQNSDTTTWVGIQIFL